MPTLFKFCTRSSFETDLYTVQESVLRSSSFLAKAAEFHVISIKRFSCWKMNKWTRFLAPLKAAVQHVHWKSFHFLSKAVLSSTTPQLLKSLLTKQGAGSSQSRVPGPRNPFLAAHGPFRPCRPAAHSGLAAAPQFAVLRAGRWLAHSSLRLAGSASIPLPVLTHVTLKPPRKYVGVEHSS